MPLSFGTRVGPYEILAPLGAGGMGEVYRATDAKLKREVALKVLPEAFASEAQRMVRFEREAQLLASLNHTNIAAIYGLEETGSVRALVMELVEGPTLAERLQQRKLPFDEALPIAKQIAEALEYAHDRGIIHRDLKPANVKVRADGTVKVLDFGLAKALADDPTSNDLSNSPTLSVAATKAGFILGTAAYMAPEQARGKSVDRRADIWSFGVVLYEILTGRQLFAGETISDSLAAVITKEPDWNALPVDTPMQVRELLQRCLRKDLRQRIQSIGDARVILEEAQNPAAAGQESASSSGRPAQRLRFFPWLTSAALVLIAAATSGLLVWQYRPTAELPLIKFNIPVQSQDWTFSWPAISPDGKMVVWPKDNQLWLRELNEIQPRLLPGTDSAQLPFWSPDSSYVGFYKEETLWKVPAAGGGATTIAMIGENLNGGAKADWAPGDKILLATGDGDIHQIPAAGGAVRSVVTPLAGQEVDFHDPSVLPGNRGLLLVPHNAVNGPDAIYVFNGPSRKFIFRSPGVRVSWPVYSQTGHILFYQNGASAGIWALPFSLSKLEATGEPFLVAPNSGLPSLSTTGTLAYIDHIESSEYQLVWVDRSGKILQKVGEPQLVTFLPAISPDGNRIAAMVRRGGSAQVWILDVARNTLTQISKGGGRFESVVVPRWQLDHLHKVRRTSSLTDSG